MVVNEIISTQDTCWGAPRLNGRRLTVFDVVSGVYVSKSISAYVNEFGLKIEDVLTALKYCSEQFCKERSLNFCSGCVLRYIKDLGTEKREEIEEIFNDDGSSFLKIDGTRYYLGSKNEYNQQKAGMVTWALAELMLKDLPAFK